MDTSIEYIEMCAKTEEIQALKPIPGCGDWSISNHNELGEWDINKILLHFQTTDKRTWGKQEHTETLAGEYWLPRQDQLQKIYKDVRHKDFTACSISYMLQNVRLFDVKQEEAFDSFEKLWLCFVMDVMSNKKWNKENKKWEIL